MIETGPGGPVRGIDDIDLPLGGGQQPVACGSYVRLPRSVGRIDGEADCGGSGAVV